jgi:hypothetical protein
MVAPVLGECEERGGDHDLIIGTSGGSRSTHLDVRNREGWPGHVGPMSARLLPHGIGSHRAERRDRDRGGFAPDVGIAFAACGGVAQRHDQQVTNEEGGARTQVAAVGAGDPQRRPKPSLAGTASRCVELDPGSTIAGAGRDFDERAVVLAFEPPVISADYRGYPHVGVVLGFRSGQVPWWFGCGHDGHRRAGVKLEPPGRRHDVAGVVAVASGVVRSCVVPRVPKAADLKVVERRCGSWNCRVAWLNGDRAVRRYDDDGAHGGHQSTMRYDTAGESMPGCQGALARTRIDDRLTAAVSASE